MNKSKPFRGLAKGFSFHRELAPGLAVPALSQMLFLIWSAVFLYKLRLVSKQFVFFLPPFWLVVTIILATAAAYTASLTNIRLWVYAIGLAAVVLIVYVLGHLIVSGLSIFHELVHIQHFFLDDNLLYIFGFLAGFGLLTWFAFRNPWLVIVEVPVVTIALVAVYAGDRDFTNSIFSNDLQYTRMWLVYLFLALNLLYQFIYYFYHSSSAILKGRNNETIS